MGAAAAAGRSGAVQRREEAVGAALRWAAGELGELAECWIEAGAGVGGADL